jgi:hypothetical protein
MVVFGLGLAATVAPLTTTVLSSVDEHNAGIASGANNAIARVAGLVAIAAMGAVMAGQFDSSVDAKLGGQARSGQVDAVVREAGSRTLAGAEEADQLPPQQRATVGPAIEESSLDAFRLGILIAAGLFIAGGLTSAIGVIDERRREAPAPGPIAATAGDCGHTDEEPAPEATERAPA